jgi:WXG100 family type VII secretion target
MAQILQINYEEMAAASQNLNAMSQEAEALLGRFDKEIQQLTGFFEGVADQELLAQKESCRQRLNHTPLMLAQMSTAIRTASEKIREGEEQAKAAISSIVVDDTN